MDKFLQDLSSGYWWITVVVVGVVINIASSYLRKFLENRLYGVSSFWKRRREQRAAKLAVALDMLRNSPELRTMLSHSEIRLRIRGLGFEIEGIAIAAFAFFAASRDTTSAAVVTSLMLAASFLLLMGLDDLRLAISASRKLNAVCPELRQLNDA